MSNNKQTMKLYTREQMIEAFNYGQKLEGFDWIGDMIDSLHAIELPSDMLCVNCDESKPTHNICMDCIIKVGKQNMELPSDEEIKKATIKKTFKQKSLAYAKFIDQQMSNNKRTSIDFLFDNLQNKAKGKLKTISKEELLIIAKDMHKQEIVDAWELSRYRLNYNHTGEEHFNVTFGE